ncbi:anaerobic ribonucleoside-triphosphate reductase activating protein [Thermosulfurimonas sp. F29]|uniref:anaerobic ribonucleoside-triphosphate reductase activating protein n=1 Tax=Thermosulfurimonas sp. F29 TaxID=2867247 RepID=UPI001C83B3CC|nr:anaerobic ribonucleoside-triphosphate reductase activating protein [Thermosulfurimonas sp. F29]MBX6422173.1 anaerobic ribonucleoside-triphosphate reductase activating protein [Thermosulfurimonas sp. F29]
MIKGFRGTSLVDYPGKIAAVVFLGGCNWRCPYCYNLDLVLPERLREIPDLPEEEVLSELSRRKGFIKGVVITGGEPTLWGRRLRAFLERVRHEVGLPVKLDTNGSHPEVVFSLVEEGLVDYLALDFKTAPSRYGELGGDFAPVARTLECVKSLNGKAEVRITVVPSLVGEPEIKEMLPYLEGVRQIALQRFFPRAETLDPSFPKTPPAEEDLLSLQSLLERHLSAKIVLRS